MYTVLTRPSLDLRTLSALVARYCFTRTYSLTCFSEDTSEANITQKANYNKSTLLIISQSALNLHYANNTPRKIYNVTYGEDDTVRQRSRFTRFTRSLHNSVSTLVRRLSVHCKGTSAYTWLLYTTVR